MSIANLTSLPAWTCLSQDGVLEALERTSVVVLHGGGSSEREVSNRSGESVLTALGSLMEQHGEAPPLRSVQGVEIDTAGRWRVGQRSLSPDEAVRELPPGALFFLALHGGDGEDGTMQDYLGSHGRLYTGSGVLSSALCMDKGRSRGVFRKAGLTTPPGRLVRRSDWLAQRRRVLMELSSFGGAAGWYIKPNHGGSSLGVRFVTRADELASSISTIIDSGDEVLVEQCIVGIEATVAVIGLPNAALHSLPVVEILPNEGRFYDYEEKYSAGGARSVCPPEQLDAESQEQLSTAALLAFRALGCEGFARFDFIVPRRRGVNATREAGLQDVFLLEANTLPGFTERSLLPKAAATAGLPFPELCLELCALAIHKGPPLPPGTRAI